MSQYNTYTSSGGGGGNEFWNDAQDVVEDAGGDPDELESVTLESEGTSGDFEPTTLSLADGTEYLLDGAAPEDTQDRLQTEWDALSEHERWLLAGGVAAVVFASVLAVGAGSRPGPQGPGGS